MLSKPNCMKIKNPKAFLFLPFLKRLRSDPTLCISWERTRSGHHSLSEWIGVYRYDGSAPPGRREILVIEAAFGLYFWSLSLWNFGKQQNMDSASLIFFQISRFKFRSRKALLCHQQPWLFGSQKIQTCIWIVGSFEDSEEIRNGQLPDWFWKAIWLLSVWKKSKIRLIRMTSTNGFY